SSGKRTGIASSNSNQRRNKGAPGAGIEVQGPLRSLPYPFAPSQQAVLPPPLQVPSSYLAHRSRRTHHRDDGPIDIGSRLRLLAPQEGRFGRRSLYAQQRALDEKLKQIKATGEALSRRDTGAPAIVPGTNAANSVPAPHRGRLATGSAQSSASHASRAGLQHFSTTAIHPAFSERQRHDGHISAQVFGVQYQQHHLEMPPPGRHYGQAQRPQHTRREDMWNVPSPGPPRHDTHAPVEVEIGAIAIQPARRHQARAHGAADDRIVAAPLSSASHDDLVSPPFYPGQAGFGQQEDVAWTSTLAGGPAPLSATVQVDTGLGDIPSNIPTAGIWAAECLAGTERVIPYDVPVLSGLGLEPTPDFEGTHNAAPTEYLPAVGPPAPIERWGGFALRSFPAN
ncbi:hypothetical protein TRAPUB_7204, partial [Trametes pubescens]